MVCQDLENELFALQYDQEYCLILSGSVTECPLIASTYNIFWVLGGSFWWLCVVD